MITHGAYHRGNIGQVLKSISVAPPRDLLAMFATPANRSAACYNRTAMNIRRFLVILLLLLLPIQVTLAAADGCCLKAAGSRKLGEHAVADVSDDSGIDGSRCTSRGDFWSSLARAVRRRGGRITAASHLDRPGAAAGTADLFLHSRSPPRSNWLQ